MANMFEIHSVYLRMWRRRQHFGEIKRMCARQTSWNVEVW